MKYPVTITYSGKDYSFDTILEAISFAKTNFGVYMTQADVIRAIKGEVEFQTIKVRKA